MALRSGLLRAMQPLPVIVSTMPQSLLPVTQQPVAVEPMIISFGHMVVFTTAAMHAVFCDALYVPHLLSVVQHVCTHSAASAPTVGHAVPPHIVVPMFAGQLAPVPAPPPLEPAAAELPDAPAAPLPAPAPAPPPAAPPEGVLLAVQPADITVAKRNPAQTACVIFMG